MWCLMRKGRVSADESQGRIRVGQPREAAQGPKQDDVLAAQAPPPSLLPATGCSVSAQLRSPAAAGHGMEWFFRGKFSSGRYLKAQHLMYTNSMNSDCPQQEEPCAGSFLFRVWHRLKEGATRTPKPQQPVLPNTKQTSWPGGQVAQGPQQNAAQREGSWVPRERGRTWRLSSGVNHLSSFTKGLKKMGEGVGESHRGAARPFSSSEKPHLLQGTCVIERDKRVFHSVNRTKQSFWTHQKYFL